MHTYTKYFLNPLWYWFALSTIGCQSTKTYEDLQEELAATIPDFKLESAGWNSADLGVQMSFKKFFIVSEAGERYLAFVAFDVNQDQRIDGLEVYDKTGAVVEKWYDFDGDGGVDMKVGASKP